MKYVFKLLRYHKPAFLLSLQLNNPFSRATFLCKVQPPTYPVAPWRVRPCGRSRRTPMTAWPSEWQGNRFAAGRRRCGAAGWSGCTNDCTSLGRRGDITVAHTHTHCHVLVADTQYKHLQRRLLASLSEEDRTRNPIYASGCSCEQSDKWLGESCGAFAESFPDEYKWFGNGWIHFISQ